MTMNPQVAGRLTVVETVYHQSPGKNPVAVESRYGRVLQSDEQAFVRNTKVKDDWTILEFGWIKDPHLISIANDEGKQFLVNPTEDELKLVATRVIEVGVEYIQGGILAFAEIHPGESLRFSPINDGNRNYMIRCRAEGQSARYQLTAVPK